MTTGTRPPRRLGGTLARELRPAPGETLGAKVSRARLVARNALVSQPDHAEELDRAGVRAPLFYELESAEADIDEAGRDQ